MCAALSRHQQEGDATLVQHATMREPPQGRGLRSSPTHAGSRMTTRSYHQPLILGGRTGDPEKCAIPLKSACGKVEAPEFLRPHCGRLTRNPEGVNMS